MRTFSLFRNHSIRMLLRATQFVDTLRYCIRLENPVIRLSNIAKFRNYSVRLNGNDETCPECRSIGFELTCSVL